MNKNNVWIFLHSPRTGGNTLIKHIIDNIPKNEIYLASSQRYKNSPIQKEISRVRFILGHATYYGIHKLVPEKEPHYFTFLRDPADRLVSFYNIKMQDYPPKKRISFEEWYKSQPKNELVQFYHLKYIGSSSSHVNVPKAFTPFLRKIGNNYKITLFLSTLAGSLKNLFKNSDKKFKNAKKMLEICDYVAITENSDKDLKLLFKRMGLKTSRWRNVNKSQKIYSLSKKMRNKIYQDHSQDYRLYKYALKLNKNQTRMK